MRGDWFSGPLLSRHFVEQMLPRAFAGRLGEASADAGHRRLRRWLAAAHAVLGPASGLRALCDVGAAPLFACLGYRLRDVTPVGSDHSGLTAMLAGTLEGSHGVTLRIVVVPWQTRLDHTWRTAIGAVRDSCRPAPGPASECASASGACRESTRSAGWPHWAFCFNGRQLRLVDIDRPYARRFLEFDLRETLNDPDRSRLFWAFARPAAFAKRTATQPSLVNEIVAACDAHGVGVREALQGGVREALELLCEELARAARCESAAKRTRPRTRSRAAPPSVGIEADEAAPARQMPVDALPTLTTLSGPATLTTLPAVPTVPTAADVVSQGLTLLYRVLFLLFAEARALVPVWHPLYRDSYTIGTLHRQAERQSPRGLWEALQAISRLAHTGCETDGLTITAFNSQLFSPDGAPLVDRARIDSAVVARILQSLMTTPGAKGRGRERITYIDLGVEQLGAVYERVLDYAPRLEAAAASRLAERARPRSLSTSREHAEHGERTPAMTLPAAITSIADRPLTRAVTSPSSASISAPDGDDMDTDADITRAAAARVSGPAAHEPRIGEPGTKGRRQSSGLRASGPRADGLRISVRRKESGTFYTPRGLADYLVRETLAPLTATATADRILSLRVLDPAMGSGAFLVCACRFLAHAYEQALAREDRPLPATDAARAEIRRTIARQCLFGVDLNPMAVQLARLSLWLTTLTTDAPLTFLDHHLRTGDSLIGASLDDLARRRPAWPMPANTHTRHRATRRAGRGDAATLPLFTGDDTSHLMRAILPARAQLTLADDRPETVHEKERLLASLARDSVLSSWLTLADLWCASWFWPSDTASPGEALGHGWNNGARCGVRRDAERRFARGAGSGADLLGPPDIRAPVIRAESESAAEALSAASLIAAISSDGARPDSVPPPTAWAALCDQVLRGSSVLPAHVARAWLERSRELAARQRFFHWTLEFPEVFFDASGEPRADGGFDAIIGNPPWDMVRDDARADVRSDARSNAGSNGSDGHESASRAAVSKFVRESGIYDTIDGAHANSYQLFVDRSLSLLRRDGGRLGLVVPWGLAADHGSARLRRRLLERCDVDTMISFDNRDGLFPIHRSLRFLLFTSTSGRATARIACRFGERDPAVLDRLGHADSAIAAGTNATSGTSRMWGTSHAPPTSAPAIETRTLAIAPALLRRVSGEGLSFPDIRSPECLALVERIHATWPALTSKDGWGVTFGRELNASDDRRRFEAAPEPPWSTNEWPVIEGKHVHPFRARMEEARLVVSPSHRDAVYTRVPGLMRHRLAYRDVSCATNRMTLIAAIIPPHVVTTHTLFCLRSPLDLDAQHALCGMMNSFVANYFVRLRIGTHVTLASLDHLPMPAPGPWTGEMAELAAHLSAPAPSESPAACRAVTPLTPIKPVTATARAAARLQALAARAYDITTDEFRHILSTFPLVDQKEKEDALDAYANLRPG